MRFERGWDRRPRSKKAKALLGAVKKLG